MGLVEVDLFISTSLVDLYMKCDLAFKACQVFNKAHIRNTALWTALISGFIENGRIEEGLGYATMMEGEAIFPNAVTYVCIIRACGNIVSLGKGYETHAEVSRKGFLKENVFVGSALVDMYAKCGLLNRAKEVLDNLPIRNVCSWTALIAGYADHGYCEKAFECYEHMQSEGVSPNVTALASILKACIPQNSLDKAQELHCEIERRGLIAKEPILGSILVHLYANSGLLIKARHTFNALSEHDVVTWTALIGGNAGHGHGEIALMFFDRMRLEGGFPNPSTFACALKACACLKETKRGSKLHLELESLGLTTDNDFVGTSLVDMYVKCGLLVEAQQAFEKISNRSCEIWNALIGGYIEHERNEAAIECCKKMQLEGVYPDPITYMSMLRACRGIGSINNGMEVHSEIVRTGLLTRHPALCNSLLELYAKCGMLELTQEVFNELPIRNIFTWNSLVSGYSWADESCNIISSLEAMTLDGIEPDSVSLFTVCHAYSRSGLCTYHHRFSEVVERLGNTFPDYKHHIFMNHVPDSADNLAKVKTMVANMPSWCKRVNWTRMLSESRYLGKSSLGKHAFEFSLSNMHLSLVSLIWNTKFNERDQIKENI
ncbi:hypothetical protein KP509_37G017700 [Ceratopteris richardii]|nr:hypothetical protein KP509_37G017700 [Ceratopteris richardii]